MFRMKNIQMFLPAGWNGVIPNVAKLTIASVTVTGRQSCQNKKAAKQQVVLTLISETGKLQILVVQ